MKQSQNPYDAPMRNRLLLHLGLHKTATTFLQKSVWPNWDGVGYAGRPNPKGFESSEQAVFSIDKPVILLSNESSGGSLKRSYLRDVSWATLREEKLLELKRLYSDKYELGVVIGLRKPEPWILSLYKHYLKYGGVETLEGFLGLNRETPPTLAHNDLLNMPKIRQIEETLGIRPFCFFSEEMKSHPADLSDAIAAFAGVPEGPSFTSSSRFNEGVDEKEARMCISINRRIVNRGCLGKGHLRRNKTLAFDLATRFGSIRSGKKPAAQLSVSEPTSAAIKELTEGDLGETISYIANLRSGCAPGKATAPHWENRLRQLIQPATTHEH